MRAFCPSRKAFSARTATARTRKVGNAAPTAGTIPCKQSRRARAAVSCRGKSRSSNRSADVRAVRRSGRHLRRNEVAGPNAERNRTAVASGTATASVRSTEPTSSVVNIRGPRLRLSSNRNNRDAAGDGVAGAEADHDRQRFRRTSHHSRMCRRLRRRPKGVPQRREAVVVAAFAGGGDRMAVVATIRRSRLRRPAGRT